MTLPYGWTNSSYQFPQGKNPVLQLPPGKYVVEASVHADGYTARAQHSFVIEPRGVEASSRLRAATPPQIVKPVVSESAPREGT